MAHEYFTREVKKELGSRLKNVKGRDLVFNLINEGGSPEEVETFISELIAAIPPAAPTIDFTADAAPLTILGESIIDNNAIGDIEEIAHLPYVEAAALMPDGHRVKEHHVPVGGVVVVNRNRVTKEIRKAVIPTIVGSDMACSLLLTIFRLIADKKWFDKHHKKLSEIIIKRAFFGLQLNPTDDIKKQPFYINRPQIGDMQTELGREILVAIYAQAIGDFGTSGDGNHFLEFGEVHYNGGPGQFGILTHFGSRRVGATIARVFEAAANNLYRMPKGVTAAPLYLDTPLGQDYWLLMNWAGEFAEQGHRWLHGYIADALNESFKKDGIAFVVEANIYSKHNFAWDTKYGIVHRKGATPAAAGQIGIIPATMGHESVIVMGLGNPLSFETASHGAGRRFARGAAIQRFGVKGDRDHTANYVMKEYGIRLYGGGPDEDPRTYKDIDEVMEHQESCVKKVGSFRPWIVRMAPPRNNFRGG